MYVRPWQHERVTPGRPPAQVDNEEAKHYEVERHALFFNDTGAKELYQQYVQYIIGRRNSRTGQLYRDDPTILAWDLINEPRCETWRARFLAIARFPQRTAAPSGLQQFR